MAGAKECGSLSDASEHNRTGIYLSSGADSSQCLRNVRYKQLSWHCPGIDSYAGRYGKSYLYCNYSGETHGGA